MDAVVTNRLRKRFGPLEVLHAIDLRVPTGSLFGFLGPNGAGKTTTIRILLGLLRASQGTALVMGQDSWRDGATLRAGVGYLPGDVRFYDNLTGRATLAFLSAARGTRCDDEIERLVHAFDLDIERRVRNYSRGMKQKLGLIQAMMHRPKLLILDEPTVSLDPLIRETLYTELRDVAAQGRTVLFSSHTLSEVDRLCDWVAILREGNLVEQQRMESLRTAAIRRVEITFKAGSQPRPTPPNGLRVSRSYDNRLFGSWVGPMEPLLTWLARSPIADVSVTPPNLDDLFLAYYTEESAETLS